MTMIRPILSVVMMSSFALSTVAQNVAINADGAAPAASALLDIDAGALPANNKRGLLVPRLALTAANVALPVVAPATSLLIYNTASAGAGVNAVTPGYYQWDGALWVRFAMSTDGWSTTGNAGTVAGTNFIGTTDAQDWVIKTGGSTAANERMRVLSAGKVVVNNVGVGPFTNDVFSVYATGTTNGTTTNTGALGTRAINGYTSTGYGVHGSTSGTTATTFGLYGAQTSATGAVNAIRGEATSVNGLAIIGISNTSAGAVPTATNARAVIGQVNGTLAGTALGIGVQGLFAATVTTGDARGVQGASPSDNGIGVAGFATNTLTTGFPVGVYGQAASGTAFGVEGVNTAAQGTGLIATGNNIAGTYLVNGSGAAFRGTGTGLVSYAATVASGTGVIGAGNGAGANTLLVGSGVAGSGVNFGVYGIASSNANGTAGAPVRAGGYFTSGAAAQAFTYVACYEGAGVPRKVMGNGTVNTVVQDAAGDHVLLSAPEAPENLFQDFGSARLVNGRAHIALDPILTRNILVNDQHPLRVFVQVRGECNGVYVTHETSAGFDVIELGGGTSNTAFHWSVTANRANVVHPDGTTWSFAEERFAPTIGPQPAQELESKDLPKDHPRRSTEAGPVLDR
jgi:hypothetical protein